MTAWLNTGTQQEREAKFVSLGMKRESADLAASDEVVWQPVRSDSERELALLFHPCGALSTASLHLLTRANGRWHVVQSVGFDCHYDDSVSFQLSSLRSPKIDDVVVHHECEGHGTGFVQQNLNVFAIKSGRLQLVLSVEEVIDANGTDNHELLQRSSFAAIESHESGIPTLQETQCEKLNGKLAVRKRRFRWSETKFRFLRSPFVSVTTESEDGSACKKLFSTSDKE
jgi:hypothetical protein